MKTPAEVARAAHKELVKKSVALSVAEADHAAAARARTKAQAAYDSALRTSKLADLEAEGYE